MIVLGIDPGSNGGMATYNSESWLFTVQKFPDTPLEVVDFIEDVHPDLIVIERQEPRPTYLSGRICPTCKQAGSGGYRTLLKSSAILYGGYRELLGVLHATRRRFEDVRPIVWRRAIGVPTGSDKAALKRRAEGLIGDQLRVTLWNADAILLATYGARLLSGRLAT